MTPCASCKCATSCANGPLAQTLPPGEIASGHGTQGSPNTEMRQSLELGGVTTTGSEVSPTAKMDEHLRRIAEDGYTILPNAIEPNTIDAIKERLLVLEDELAVVPAANRFEGTKTTRIYNLLAHGRTFEQFQLTPTCSQWSSVSSIRGS